jgi:hypothetical protein
VGAGSRLGVPPLSVGAGSRLGVPPLSVGSRSMFGVPLRPSVECGFRMQVFEDRSRCDELAC